MLGAHNKDTSEESQISVGIEEQFVFPGWNPNTIDNDIMLFKLDEDVEFNDNISPVCLPSSADDELEEGLIVQTTGWGNTQCKFERCKSSEFFCVVLLKCLLLDQFTTRQFGRFQSWVKLLLSCNSSLCR